MSIALASALTSSTPVQSLYWPLPRSGDGSSFNFLSVYIAPWLHGETLEDTTKKAAQVYSPRAPQPGASQGEGHWRLHYQVSVTAALLPRSVGTPRPQQAAQIYQ